MTRRLDPESTGPVHWPSIWRSLKVYGQTHGRVFLAPEHSPFWGDAGYCLDRPNTRAELEANRIAKGWP